MLRTKLMLCTQLVKMPLERLVLNLLADRIKLALLVLLHPEVPYVRMDRGKLRTGLYGNEPHAEGRGGEVAEWQSGGMF